MRYLICVPIIAVLAANLTVLAAASDPPAVLPGSVADSAYLLGPGDVLSIWVLGADEISITNSLRIGWLMMNGLNKIDPGPGDPPDSPTSRLLRWVDGSKWQYICDSDYRNNRLVKVFQ